MEGGASFIKKEVNVMCVCVKKCIVIWHLQIPNPASSGSPSPSQLSYLLAASGEYRFAPE